MKKVLSLVLAVMMVVGMTTVAFAALSDGTQNAPMSLGTLKDTTKYTATLIAAGTITDTEKIDKVDVTGIGTDLKDSVIADYLNITPASVNINAAKGQLEIDATTKKGLPDGDYEVSIVVTAEAAASGSKTTETFSSVSFTVKNEKVVDPDPDTGKADKVPSGWKITGFDESYFDDNKWEPVTDNWNKLSSAGLTKADEKSFLPLKAGMFTWKNSQGHAGIWTGTPANKEALIPFAEDATLTSSQLSDIGVRRSFQKGTGNTIRDAEVRTADSAVRVRTVKFYPLTKETDVELKLTLTYKGSTKKAPEYTYVFTIENDKEMIEEDQFEVYSYGNLYLEADATVRNVEFQGDEDEIVYATKTVVKGQKYYFNVTDELEKVDEQMIADNPEIDSIYNVYQSNMANATVQFKNLDREFFVYDAEGKLLGTTKDSKLPLARKYILTTSKVDFGGAEEEPVEEPTEEPADVDAPPMGGGEVPPSNNYNPNTGL